MEGGWLGELVGGLAESGARLVVEVPGREPLRAGPRPERARVVFRDPRALDALRRRDHLRLAEAYLAGQLDVHGDLREAVRVVDHLDLAPRRRDLVPFWIRLLLDRRRFDRASVRFHYDRDPDFFLPWLGATRSYTHGFYESSGDDLDDAQRRKLDFALAALEAKPGMELLDVGCGWGSFLEHAGGRGVRVHGLTLSADQARFVAARADARGLPCRVECVDFHDFRPARRFDGAVLMGSLEHLPDYRAVARRLARLLRPGASLYTDFVSSREGRLAGAFLRRHVFPGVSGYVQVPKLVAALEAAGFRLQTLHDDSGSCALTVRDWARALEERRAELAARHGEPAVRAFLLYLWGSHHFLEVHRTQAYHLVATLAPA